MLKLDFGQDATIPGITVAYGVASLGVLGLVHTLSTMKPTDDLDHVVAPLMLCSFGILPAIGVTLWRLFVPVPNAVSLPRVCPHCNLNRNLVPVWYLQSVSVIVLFFMAQTRGFLCRSCSHLTFLRMTFWTIVGSPWGIFGILVGPWYILSNVLFLVRTFWPTLNKRQANSALAVYRDYAVNLLRSKDESTVIDVLHKQSGVPRTEVAAYLSKIRAELLQQ
jgi:hypothetical protein